MICQSNDIGIALLLACTVILSSCTPKINQSAKSYWAAVATFEAAAKAKDDKHTIANFRELSSYDQPLSRYYYREVADAYLRLGDTTRAIANLMTFISQGEYNLNKVFGFEKYLEADIIEMYGEEVWPQVLEANANSELVQSANQNTQLLRLQRTLKEDIRLRKDTTYDCSTYGFAHRLGIPYAYDTLNHQQLMDCYYEYKRLDSINLQLFVSYIDSIGYVPPENTLGGVVGFTTMIVHTANHRYEEPLRKICWRSMNKGTVSPRQYAWYYGYAAGNKQWPRKYYYTLNEEEIKALPPEKIEELNRERAKIGLAPWPAVVWGN